MQRDNVMDALMKFEGNDIWITSNQRTGININGDELKAIEILERLDGLGFILEESDSDREFAIDIRDIKEIDDKLKEQTTLCLYNGINYTLEIVQ